MDQAINNYTAILLAAGFGSRIAGLTDRPKCLLEINGKSLLEHHLETWKRNGIRKVHLVLGYQAEVIEERLKAFEGELEISVSYNEEYRTKGNTYSLWCGLKYVSGPILIFDADLIYEDAILANFLNDESSDQVLVGAGSVDDIECAKVLINGDGDVIKTVDKRAFTPEELAQYEFVGEALGILKFSAAGREKLLAASEVFLSKEANIPLNWEHLLNEFLPTFKVGVHFNKSTQWIEIDTPEDFAKAQGIFESNQKA